MFAESLQYIIENPLFTFTLLLLVSLTVPPIFERMKLPGLVGLLFAGILLGKNVLGFLDSESETMILFSEIGKIYLMFVAGLEINLADFRKKQDRSLGFGLLTFLVPLLVGTGIGLFFDFGWNASILIGSLLASHTLLAYPIVNRLGLLNNEGVTITIGATIFTDIAALLVLAICVSINQGDFSLNFLLLQLISLGVYGALVLFGLSWLGKEFFKRNGDEEGNQFLFILLAVFLASVGAQLINVDKIVGAFLAGLAVNDVVGRSPVEEKIEFVGSTLFIPFFFVGMGLLLDVNIFVENLLTQFPLTFSIVVGLLGSKLIAAAIAKYLYGYRWLEALMMWSLSVPQVAATLAAALVGFRVGLLDESVFNAVIVLMLVTSTLGPILTRRFGRLLQGKTKGEPHGAEMRPEELPELPVLGGDFKVMVPIANPRTQDYLLETAGLITQISRGTMLPLSIVTAHVHMDSLEVTQRLKQSENILSQAIAHGEKLNIPTLPKIRIDDDLAAGITRAAREANVDLILMGWAGLEGIKARLFGNLLSSVCWSAHCPVAMIKFLQSPRNFRRIMVPFKGVSAQNFQIVRFAQLLAIANNAEVTLFHVCERWMTKEQRNTFRLELQHLLTEVGITSNVQIKLTRYDDVAKAIIHDAKDFDLVILHSTRYRTAGGLAVGDVTTKISSQLQTSIVIFNELET
ncbi:sodium:proton antiporter [Synechococcus moorigangaii CMS01]|nr:sodium:proton antiporter [Synechococcus moorigangaii CMS01]